MDARRLASRVALSLAFVVGLSAVVAPVAAKDPKEKPEKAKAGPKPQTGISRLETPLPLKGVLMWVPKDYDPTKWYPLAFVLHPLAANMDANKPEPWVDIWARELGKRGWIIAGPWAPEYHTENTEGPLMNALRMVESVYHIDDRRVVLIGHNAGVQMAWHLAVKSPVNFAAVVAFSADIGMDDRAGLKGLAGKSAYLFCGEKGYYTPAMLATDKQFLEGNKVIVTVQQKKDWGEDFPVTDAGTIAAWIDKIYPVGDWGAKADAVRKALDAKDLAAASKALGELAASLKKAPYGLFERRAADLSKELLDAGRALIEDAKKAVDADPLDADARMEAAVKALKGIKPLDDEATKALAALKKLPAVIDALKKKDAETAGSSLMDRASAAEGKGDLAKALEAYRKAAALDWSRKAEAAAKVAELEPKVPGK
jgi:pimeloyl-ACP methyl ester carboxylesterase